MDNIWPSCVIFKIFTLHSKNNIWLVGMMACLLCKFLKPFLKSKNLCKSIIKSFYAWNLHNTYVLQKQIWLNYYIHILIFCWQLQKSYVKNTGTTIATIFSSILKSACVVSFGLDVMVTSVAVASVVKFKLIFESSIVINLEEKENIC